MKLGLIVLLTQDADECLDKVKSLRFPTCQVTAWTDDVVRPEIAARLRSGAEQRGIEITTLWVSCGEPQVWDFISGPSTIGLVPRASRWERVERLKRGSDFAALVGAPSITTHVGFLPEWPGDPEYPDIVEALRTVALHCQKNGQGLWFETGQETPTTLLRVMQDVGTGNLGVNLDPANLIMYGKANPVDSLDTIGRYVRGVHAKDGEYPTDGRQLGLEKPLGEGRVDFPLLIRRLKSMGYTGPLTIEREVSGPEQIAGIEQARRVLEPLL